MSSTLQLFILATTMALAAAAPKTPEKPPSCKEFSRDVSFNDSQAVGTWHLLHYKTEKSKGSGESHCVQFTPVGDQERTDLSKRIGMFVSNLKWENLALKMQIPCVSGEKPPSGNIRDYYLEKLQEDGSYQTLQMPGVKSKLDSSDFHRYPMRLKIIEGQYLGMMDCHEKFVFLLGKEPPKGELDERLQKMIETYWPEEH